MVSDGKQRSHRRRNALGCLHEFARLAWSDGLPRGRRGSCSPHAEGRKTGGGDPPDEKRARDSDRRDGRLRRRRYLERIQTLKNCPSIGQFFSSRAKGSAACGVKSANLLRGRGAGRDPPLKISQDGSIYGHILSTDGEVLVRKQDARMTSWRTSAPRA